MYDYDRRDAVLAFEHEAYDYQRVMSALKQDIVRDTFTTISTVLTFAKDAIRALTTNQSLEDHDTLEKANKKLTSLARWMITRREVEAEPVAQFAKLTDDLTKETSFWSRPWFLNKGDHTAKVEAIVQKLNKVKRDVIQAFKLSGSLPATRIPV